MEVESFQMKPRFAFDSTRDAKDTLDCCENFTEYKA